jgi:hypothetical protein
VGGAKVIDWDSLLIGAFLGAAIDLLFFLFAPERWKEPVDRRIRLVSKWLQNPELQISVIKRLGLSLPVPLDELSRGIASTLESQHLWAQHSIPASFSFAVRPSGKETRVTLVPGFDPEAEGKFPPAVIMTLEASASYRQFRDALENIRAGDDIVRRALQEGGLMFTESLPQIAVTLESEFPLSSFFRTVQPVILKCETKDKHIDFDYSPGKLLVRAELDAQTTQWLKSAISAM